MPPAPPIVTIAHLSDPHLGAHFADALRDLPADVAAARPTATVVTGDLTMRARPVQFRQSRELLDRLPRPLLVLIGNHDIPLHNPVARLARPYAGYRAHIDAELDPVLAAPGLLVLGLGSAVPWRWKQGRVSRRQVEAVVRSFSVAPPPTVRVVALHHPPSQRGAARLVGRSGLLAALKRAGVDLVLAGHTHLPLARRLAMPGGGRPGPVEVVAGTATSDRSRGVGCSWTLVRVDADAITIEHRRYAGIGWHGGEQIRFSRHRAAG